jgi:hypothetical protein
MRLAQCDCCISDDVVSTEPVRSAPAVMTCLVIHSIESMANMMKLGIRFDSNLHEA